MNMRISGLFAVILVGCAAASLPASTAGNDRISTAGLIGPIDNTTTERYYPLKSFFSWTYTVTIKTADATTSAEDTVRVESLVDTGTKSGTLSYKRTIGGTPVYDGTGTVNQTSNALVITRDGATEVIALPLRAGNDWTSGTLAAHSYKVDKLTVGSTVYADLIAISYSKDGEVVAVRWLAPKVGIVKQLTRSRSDASVVETVSELKSAKTIAITKVTLSPAASFSLSPGATASLSAIAATEQDGLFSQELSFSTDKPAVLTVAKGVSSPSGLKAVVTAVATGTATVTAKSDQDPTMVATSSIDVK